MPRSKNDPYKRKAAQAINHLAAAVLDVNEIYVAFDEQTARTRERYAQDPTEANKRKQDQYETYTAQLKTVMMGTAALREHIILFIGEVWDLDEESVRVYLG